MIRYQGRSFDSITEAVDALGPLIVTHHADGTISVRPLAQRQSLALVEARAKAHQASRVKRYH